MQTSWKLSLALLAALLAPGRLAAQIPDEFKNLKVLPKDIKKEDLVQTMRGYALALGVRCAHCHVGEEGKPLSTFDFASDTKTTKDVARQMIRMVTDLNGKYIARIKTGRKEKFTVSCGTCHHGLSRPEDLEATLLGLTQTTGVDAALDKYRELRDRYYGGYEYDFSPRPLNTLAEFLGKAGKLNEAIRVQEYNAELHPRDAQLHAMLGNLRKRLQELEQEAATP